MHIFFNTIIISTLLVCHGFSVYGMEQNISTDIKELIFADLNELKCSGPSDFIGTDTEGIFPKPNRMLKTVMRKNAATWTIITKRYFEDQPLCTVALSCDCTLNIDEFYAIQRLLAEVVFENNKCTNKIKATCADQISPRLYLSRVTTTNENAQSFLIVGQLK